MHRWKDNADVRLTNRDWRKGDLNSAGSEWDYVV
jgi:hypothetical protein